LTPKGNSNINISMNKRKLIGTIIIISFFLIALGMAGNSDYQACLKGVC
jgi:hypothetical protein